MKPLSHVHIIGGGPAGLTAAYALLRRGIRSTVFEADTIVGGIARTENYKGYRFDIGGHRFFSKVRAVRHIWHDLLGTEILTRPRLSRIYFNGRFFDYPLKASNALQQLGLVKAVAIVLSYGWAQVRPITPERSFEDWVINRFGRVLYETFFKAYTEKVWGIPCTTISAQWAAQRIKGLSLWVAAREMLTAPFRREPTKVRTLIEQFEYPRLGPGQMWEAAADRIRQSGGTVELSTEVARILHDGAQVTAVEVTAQGTTRTMPVEALISTMPLRTLVERLSPPPPDAVREAAGLLRYRDFLTVALMLDRRDTFPDNWIYIHDPNVKMGRIQNFRNWSPDLVPEANATCLGLEYFCFEGDGLWSMSDAELIALGTRELEVTGLARAADVRDGAVVRVPKAYPVYDGTHVQALETLRAYFDGFSNLTLAGRNGLHKYNNQDHSMITGILAAEALQGRKVDPWTVNVEDEYLEEGDILDVSAGLDDLLPSQPPVPETVAPAGSPSGQTH
jgi:protoporphyrinogen oxidase